MNTMVVMDRHIETHKVFHLERDSGFAKLDVSPLGAGIAGVSSEGAMAKDEYTRRLGFEHDASI